LTSQDASKVIKLLQERSLDQIKEFVGVEEAEQAEAGQIDDVASLFEGSEVIDVEEPPF